MAKKIEKIVDDTAIIKDLVFDLGEKAFSYCSENLFDIFGYKCIEKKDFRAIDLCEQILVSIEECGDVAKNGGCISYYATLLGQHMEDYCNCLEGARAYKYKEKAKSLLLQSKTEDSLDELSDATMIFISIFREYYNAGVIRKEKIEDAKFDVMLEDVELLKAIHEGIRAHGVAKLKLSRQSDEKKQLFLILSTLFLARGLQARGLL